MAKAKTGKDTTDARAAAISQLLTDPIVDLDVYGEGSTSYTLTDAKANQHTFAVPNDPPFPIAVALLHAHDDWTRLQQELLAASAKADNPRNRAERRKVEARLTSVWARLMDAFAALASIRLDEPISGQSLGIDYGTATLEQWIGTVIVRLQIRRMGPDLEAVIEQLLHADAPEPEPESAAPFVWGSGESSEHSEGSTAGATTTGAP